MLSVGGAEQNDLEIKEEIAEILVKEKEVKTKRQEKCQWILALEKFKETIMVLNYLYCH